MKNVKELFLEFFGTFWLTMTVAGAVLANVGVVGIALSLGLGVAALLYATGKYGAGHYNPAITVGMWAAKKIDAVKGIKYIAAQLIGGVFAALILGMFFTNAAAGNYGATILASGVGFWQGLLIETILTMFLVFTVLETDAAHAPIAIGFVLAFDVFLGGGLTGASMNPARSFGPALLSGMWKSHMVFWIGPVIGSLVAVGLHRFYSKK